MAVMSGSIDHLEYIDVTPIIGRECEYPTAKLKDMLHAPNFEDQIRDSAITNCERGVVFYCAPQADLTVAEQKTVTVLLGQLTGRPRKMDYTSIVHPLYRDPNNIPMEDGTTDEMRLCEPKEALCYGYPLSGANLNDTMLISPCRDSSSYVITSEAMKKEAIQDDEEPVGNIG